MKLQAFDSSYFREESPFEDDVILNYILFQPVYKYFKNIASSDFISERKSKGLSNESINSFSLVSRCQQLKNFIKYACEPLWAARQVCRVYSPTSYINNLILLYFDWRIFNLLLLSLIMQKINKLCQNFIFCFDQRFF